MIHDREREGRIAGARTYPRHFLMMQMWRRGEIPPMRWISMITTRALASNEMGTGLTIQFPPRQGRYGIDPPG